jgi:hypothetical protein
VGSREQRAEGGQAAGKLYNERPAVQVQTRNTVQLPTYSDHLQCRDGYLPCPPLSHRSTRSEAEGG